MSQFKDEHVILKRKQNSDVTFIYRFTWFWNTLAFDPSHPQPLNLQASTTSDVSNVAGKSQGKGHFLPPTCDLDVALPMLQVLYWLDIFFTNKLR